MSFPDDVLLVDLNRAAEILGQSRRYIEQKVATGELLSVRLGKNRRIATQDLQEFVQRLREHAERERLQPEMKKAAGHLLPAARRGASSSGRPRTEA